MAAPAHPKLYHIVHVDRLAPIIAAGGLLSDRILQQRDLAAGTTIGMGKLKARRFAAPVTCHPGTHVSDYVPFYLCSRSIMLYVIHMANHVSLEYRGGQRPIVHLELDLHRVIAWANERPVWWAFSLGNATAQYAEFRDDLAQLDEVDWSAVANPDFRDPQVKEGKQSEFLVHRGVPWPRVERIGVFDLAAFNLAAQAIEGTPHRPRVQTQSGQRRDRPEKPADEERSAVAWQRHAPASDEARRASPGDPCGAGRFCRRAASRVDHDAKGIAPSLLLARQQNRLRHGVVLIEFGP